MRKYKCPSCGAQLRIRVEMSAPLVMVEREPEQAPQLPAASLADRIRAALETRRVRGASVRELQRGPLQGVRADALLSALEEMADAGAVCSQPDVAGRGRIVWRVAAASETEG